MGSGLPFPFLPDDDQPQVFLGIEKTIKIKNTSDPGDIDTS